MRGSRRIDSVLNGRELSYLGQDAVDRFGTEVEKLARTVAFSILASGETLDGDLLVTVRVASLDSVTTEPEADVR